MSDEQRDFRGIWIPAELWLDKTLTPGQKLMIAEVESLGGFRAHGCFKSNERLAERFQVTVKTIENLICTLKEKGFFRVEGRGKDRRIYLTEKARFYDNEFSRKTGDVLPKNGRCSPEKREIEDPSHIYGESTGRKKREGGRQGADDLLPEVTDFQCLWNASEALPKIRTMTQGRKRALAARMKDKFWADNWKPALAKVLESKFLMGENDRGWRADVDWFLRPDSVAKILEGKYDRSKLTVSGKSAGYDATRGSFNNANDYAGR